MDRTTAEVVKSMNKEAKGQRFDGISLDHGRPARGIELAGSSHSCQYISQQKQKVDGEPFSLVTGMS